ncbi:staygreen family protein [Pseudalkalibacillus sp. SCS-8]|uniref:staygreen family protein n=1 Tax=Pseudalkalibacillus nanhaiensis TaxID=3115291 RepID=UPI0032DA9BCD
MSTFDPQKLSTTFLPPVNPFWPRVGRKYTLTHSDITGELFLTVGCVYDYESIDQKMRDEVLAEWLRDRQGRYYLSGEVYVDGGEFSKEVAEMRFKIFQREMGTALKGMLYGDKSFLSNYPYLLDAPISITFKTTFPSFSRTLSFGTLRDYI